MNPRLKRRIRTILYQDQRFTEAELDLLHTPSLQRLYDLRQLGFADRVFVDASHTRLAHVLGVMEIAMKIVESIGRNLEREADKRGFLEWRASEKNVRVHCKDVRAALHDRFFPIRLIALLHDLTHAPYGHTLEDEIKLVPISHDAPGRQADAFLKLVAEYLAWTAVETVDPQIYKRIANALDFDALLAGQKFYFEKELDEHIVSLGCLVLQSDMKRHGRSRVDREGLAELLIDLNFATRALYHLEISHKFNNPKSSLIPEDRYRVNDILEQILERSSKNDIANKWALERKNGPQDTPPLSTFHANRDAYCLDIIGDTICADLLDYASRDAQLSGLPLAFDLNRIVENFTIVTHIESNVEPKGHPFEGPCLRAAVDFSRGKFRSDVVGVLMELLQVRYYVYERVLFHPTKCVAGAMLGRSIQLLGFKQIPANWQKVGDAVFLQQVREVALIAETALRTIKSRDPKSGDLFFWGKTADDTSAVVPSIGLPVFDIARELFRQRQVRLSDLKRKFEHEKSPERLRARLLHWWHETGHSSVQVAEAMSSALSMINGSDEQVLSSSINQEITERVCEITSNHSPSISRADVKLFLERQVPTIDYIISEVLAAQHLLSRLGSRRFAKRVFCLMPANIKTSGLNISQAEIAQRFLDPALRSIAERMIEEKAKLPLGSVVIHCPPGQGPVKAANVLVTYIPPVANLPGAGRASADDPESRRRSAKLREIDKIGDPAGPIFAAHAKLVTSLEEMYASMWRLWVAVSPPNDYRYDEIANTISLVISTVAIGAQTGIPNDVFMVEELQETYSGNYEAAPTKVSGGSDTSISASELEAILKPYIDVFTTRNRKILTGKLDELRPKLLARLEERDIKTFVRSARISIPLQPSKWDARNIESFVTHISRLTNEPYSSLIRDREVSYRSFSTDERKAIAILEERVFREVRHTNARNKSGAISLSKLAKSENVDVKFQPLLCSGLYGTDGTRGVILINSGKLTPNSLRAQYDSDEVRPDGTADLMPTDIRFTLAHELVHHFISRSSDSTLVRGRDEQRVQDIGERICDELAAKLIFPDSVVAEFMADQPLTASKTLEALKRYGIPTWWLIQRLGDTERFFSEGQGYGVIYAKRNGKDLVTLRAAVTRTMQAKAPIFSNLSYGDRLPFSLQSLQNDSGTGRMVTIERTINSASSDTVDLRLSVATALSESPEEHRLLVIELK